MSDYKTKMDEFVQAARQLAARLRQPIPGDTASRSTPLHVNDFVLEPKVNPDTTDMRVPFQIDFKLQNYPQAVFGGVYVPGPKNGIENMWFNAMMGFNDRGMGHEVLRRFLNAAPDFCDYVATTHMVSALNYFGGMGFKMVDGQLDIRRALEEGVTLGEIAEAFAQQRSRPVPLGTPFAVDGMMHPKSFLDLTGPQRGEVYQKIGLPAREGPGG